MLSMIENYHINQEFLKKQMWQAHYSLKEGTNASYIFQPYLSIEAIQDSKQRKVATAQMVSRMQDKGQEMLLPFRICFIYGEDSAPVNRTGRGKKKKVAQMKASFTIPEQSPYKLAKPYRVCTSIWQVEGHKCFYFGTIGINLAENQKPKDNGDLVIFYTPDWKEIDVFIFKGLVKPNDIANLQEAVRFVEANVVLG